MTDSVRVTCPKCQVSATVPASRAGHAPRCSRCGHQGWHVDLAVKTPLPQAVQAFGGPEDFGARGPDLGGPRPACRRRS